MTAGIRKRRSMLFGCFHRWFAGYTRGIYKRAKSMRIVGFLLYIFKIPVRYTMPYYAYISYHRHSVRCGLHKEDDWDDTISTADVLFSWYGRYYSEESKAYCTSMNAKRNFGRDGLAISVLRYMRMKNIQQLVIRARLRSFYYLLINGPRRELQMFYWELYKCTQQ